MTSFSWLQAWYAQHCDGDWEHGFGISIGTLDNPGWSIRVSLEDTELEDAVFQPLTIDRSETDWLHCRVQDHRFEGFGGVANLEEILDVFRQWAAAAQ